MQESSVVPRKINKTHQLNPFQLFMSIERWLFTRRTWYPTTFPLVLCSPPIARLKKNWRWVTFYYIKFFCEGNQKVKSNRGYSQKSLHHVFQSKSLEFSRYGSDNEYQLNMFFFSYGVILSRTKYVTRPSCVFCELYVNSREAFSMVERRWQWFVVQRVPRNTRRVIKNL